MTIKVLFQKNVFLVLALISLFGCGPQRYWDHQAAVAMRPSNKNHYKFYMYDIFVGKELVHADTQTEDLIKSYFTRKDKGKWLDGRRLTIFSDLPTISIGDTVQIFHIYEDCNPKADLYVMGPKRIRGLWVDGKCIDDGDMNTPYPDVDFYQGMTIQCPGWDYNFEITKLTFSEPGQHEIVWKTAGLISNICRIEVLPPKD